MMNKRKRKKYQKYLMKNKILLLIPAFLIIGAMFLVNMQGIIGGAPGEPAIGDEAQEEIIVDGITYGVLPVDEDTPSFELPILIIGLIVVIKWRKHDE